MRQTDKHTDRHVVVVVEGKKEERRKEEGREEGGRRKRRDHITSSYYISFLYNLRQTPLTYLLKPTDMNSLPNVITSYRVSV